MYGPRVRVTAPAGAAASTAAASSRPSDPSLILLSCRNVICASSLGRRRPPQREQGGCRSPRDVPPTLSAGGRGAGGGWRPAAARLCPDGDPGAPGARPPPPLGSA